MIFLRTYHVQSGNVSKGSTVWLDGGIEYDDAGIRTDQRRPATVKAVTPKGWLRVTPDDAPSTEIVFRPSTYHTYYKGPPQHHDIWITEAGESETDLRAAYADYTKRLADAEAAQMDRVTAEMAARSAREKATHREALEANKGWAVAAVTSDIWQTCANDRTGKLYQIFFGLRPTVNYYDFTTNTVHSAGYFIVATSYHANPYRGEDKEWHGFTGSNFVPAKDLAEGLQNAKEWLVKAVW